MRRALSKRRHRMTTEAVYEKIQHRHNHFTQRANEFKTAYYDDVTNGSGLKEEMVKEITAGYYDDVITDGLKPETGGFCGSERCCGSGKKMSASAEAAMLRHLEIECGFCGSERCCGSGKKDERFCGSDDAAASGK
ncbi:hypothetical protein QQF64_035244 [Cirrhinus molitorella]|uniref:Uncharacterized protein n=1 Tax=Cirrhinus molitorella TaxID=172907 RepID=A0ABR3NF83_9TELE